MNRLAGVVVILAVALVVWYGLPPPSVADEIPPCYVACNGYPGDPNCTPNQWMQCWCTDWQMNCHTYCNLPARCE